MKYIIMCGGKYDKWETPKQLQKVFGYPIVQWTIWNLMDHGIHPHDIFISSNDSRFDGFGIDRLQHENNFEVKDGKKISGYWVDAFYPTKEPTTYLFGDVYYSTNAIKTIIENHTDNVLFFGSRNLKREDNLKEWEEPFAFKVVNQRLFRAGIEACKELCDEGLTNREPIAWELYRVINGYNINKHIIGDNYIPIDDITTDFDTPEELEKFKEKFEEDEILNPYNT